jgi:lipoate-protein ligase A
MSSEVACQAAALREGLETSLDISHSKESQRFLNFAWNDRREDTTSYVFSLLHIYHDISPHRAAMNMAIDEALLEHATVPSIRFYRWYSPALSFGYFGKFSDVASFQGDRDLVRRWTGGGIVFHGDDLTYSIVIPGNHPAFVESSRSIYEKVHRALCEALNGIGRGAKLSASAALHELRKSRKGDLQIALAVENRRSLGSAVIDRRYNACFAHPVRSDVMIDGRKIAGAAQRRTRGGLLQQGSIQGIEVENGLADRFAEELSTDYRPRSLPEAVHHRAREIAARKYATDAWLRKR